MSEITFRRGTAADIPAIVAMLADDPLGATRESPDDMWPYETAFAAIDADPHQHLVVVDRGGAVVGTMQLTVIPGLSRKGASRMLIEGVRIHADARGTGLGTQMIEWAIQRARDEGCAMVQLTTDATRKDAHRFYERLGFEPSHIGFKMMIERGNNQ